MSFASRDAAVSVVLPFRDAAETLGDAVESMRRQSHRDFECLLIDNRSTDASAQIARAICAQDARFQLLRLPGTMVDALNAGLAAARAPLVARMDADDLAHPQRLERQLAALAADPSLSIASCLIACFPTAALRAGMLRYEHWLNSLRTPDEIRNAMFVESPLVHPSVVMTRAALDDVGGYRDTGGPEDYDLFMRLLLRGHRATKVAEVLLHWRDSPARLTRADPRYSRAQLMQTKLRHLPSAIAPGPLQIWGAGPIGRHWARAVRGLGYTVRRFIDVDPRKIGRRASGVPIEPPECLAIGDGFLLAAVGSPGAREQIERFVQERGWRPWNDYLCVA